MYAFGLCNLRAYHECVHIFSHFWMCLNFSVCVKNSPQCILDIIISTLSTMYLLVSTLNILSMLCVFYLIPNVLLILRLPELDIKCTLQPVKYFHLSNSILLVLLLMTGLDIRVQWQNSTDFSMFHFRLYLFLIIFNCQSTTVYKQRM